MQFVVRYTSPDGKWIVEEFGRDYLRAQARQIALARERLRQIEEGRDKVIGYPYLEIGGGMDDRTS